MFVLMLPLWKVHYHSALLDGCCPAPSPYGMLHPTVAPAMAHIMSVASKAQSSALCGQQFAWRGIKQLLMVEGACDLNPMICCLNSQHETRKPLKLCHRIASRVLNEATEALPEAFWVCKVKTRPFLHKSCEVLEAS